MSIDLNKIKAMSNITLEGKVLLIREDLNAPMESGKVTSDARLLAAVPTIEQALRAGAKVILMSHYGRPVEGSYDKRFSLQPIAKHLAGLIDSHLMTHESIPVINDWQTQGVDLANYSLVMLENVRFNVGEKNNAEALALQYANLADVFVMDAFGTAHRAQASTEGVSRQCQLLHKEYCAGPLLMKELQALSNVLNTPKKPLLAIVGGAKVSSKLEVLNSLTSIVDYLIIGGGIANTFLAASGKPIGKSLYEDSLIEKAKQLLSRCEIPLPIDVYVAKSFSAEATAVLKWVDDVAEDDMILDIGPQTQQQQADIIAKAHTILWNGPVGVFEFQQFSSGTESLSRAVATSNGFSVAGGGDTIAAIEKYQIASQLSYISTGGGAFLEMIEGKVLPAVAALQAH